MTRAVLSHRLRAHGKLVHDEMDMNGKSAAVDRIGLIVELLE